MEHKANNDEDFEDTYNECILVQKDRRMRICDSPNKKDGIIQCIGIIKSEYILDKNTKKVESTLGTGTAIHIDKQTNNVYILTAAHNIFAIERRCKNCDIKTLRKICPSCTTDTSKGNLIQPTKVYFVRRDKKFKIIIVYVPAQYRKLPSAKSGYDICIIIFKCHDQEGIDLYSNNCSKIRLINDAKFGGNKCKLYIYGYPSEKKGKKDTDGDVYYLYGMGTSKPRQLDEFKVEKNKNTNKLYIVNKAIDTTSGQSGSCVYSYYGQDHGQYLIYGIHTGGSQTNRTNFGTFFDTETMDWMADAVNNVPLSKFIIFHPFHANQQIKSLKQQQDQQIYKNINKKQHYWRPAFYGGILIGVMAAAGIGVYLYTNHYSNSGLLNKQRQLKSDYNKLGDECSNLTHKAKGWRDMIWKDWIYYGWTWVPWIVLIGVSNCTTKKRTRIS